MCGRFVSNTPPDELAGPTLPAQPPFRVRKAIRTARPRISSGHSPEVAARHGATLSRVEPTQYPVTPTTRRPPKCGLPYVDV